MGGPAVGFLPALPTPTVTAGAVMQHDAVTGAMTGFASGSAVGGGMDHSHHQMAEPSAPMTMVSEAVLDALRRLFMILARTRLPGLP